MVTLSLWVTQSNSVDVNFLSTPKSRWMHDCVKVLLQSKKEEGAGGARVVFPFMAASRRAQKFH